jgi:hypothetical protein
MSIGVQLLLLSVAAAGAIVAAFCGLLCLRRNSAANGFTREAAVPILRSETDIVRGAIQNEARWLRQELGQSLAGFQEMTLTTFGTLRDGIDGQVRTFGEMQEQRL